MIHYKNITLNFEDTGFGKCIVFLHGFLEDITIWDTLSEKLNDHRIIKVDLLGHGKTGHLSVQTMHNMADAVYHIISHLKIDEIYLVGHSMGGYVSLAFAEIYSNLVNSLMLLNSTTNADSNSKKTQRDRAIAAVKANKSIYIKSMINNLFASKNQGFSETQSIFKKASKISEQAIIASIEGMKNRPDRTHIMRNLVNTYIASGKKDSLLSFKNQKEIAEYTDSILIELEGGHMGMFEDVNTVADAIQHMLHSN